MRRDKRVFVIGQDVGVYGGAFKVTLGFQEEFGAWRVIDAPLSETAILGGATGAAIMGMRPVAEMQFADFVSCGWDHLVTVAAKQRWRAGTPVPITLRLPSGRRSCSLAAPFSSCRATCLPRRRALRLRCCGGIHRSSASGWDRLSAIWCSIGPRCVCPPSARSTCVR